MKVGDLVKYHRAGKSPKLGIVLDVEPRSGTYVGGASYYIVEFTHDVRTMKLRKDHLEVISESR